MDISCVAKDNFKIKTKAGSLLLSEELITISHKSGGDDFVVNEPGEYEVEGISVFGYKSEENNVYVVQYEDLRVLYMGAIAKPLSEKAQSELENIDVVIFSTDNMESKGLCEVVSKLEPYYVLPYGEKVAKFVTEYEHGSRSVKSLNLSRVSLPEDLTEVIVFE